MQLDSTSKPTTTPMRRAMTGLACALGLVLPGHVNAQAQRATLEVSIPNGNASASVEDLQLQSTAGPVKWLRVWNGQEWKFNPHWESLSQSWKNLTGSKVADTTGSSSSGGSGGGSGGMLSSGGSSSAEAGCWVMVDEDWQPTVGTTVVGGPPEASPLIALRSEPFNRMIGLDDAQTQANYPPVQIVNIDYANLCYGTGYSTGAIDFEAIRRQNELYLGNAGRYAFDNRTVLEKRAVSQLPLVATAALQEQLSSGRYTVAPETNPKGFRWADRGGDWIDYNTQGQVVAWGDANNNTVWLARDTSGILHGVVDANGRVLFTVHYDASGWVSEVRDYPIAGQEGELPQRSVKYQYDGKHRLHVVTDARGYDTTYDYDLMNNIVKVTDAELREDHWVYAVNTVKQHTAPDGGVTDYQFDYDDVNKQFNSKITGPETEAGRRVENLTHNRVGKLVRQVVNGRTDDEVRYDTGERAELHTNARGFTTKTVRNEFDQVVRTEHPDGGVTRRGYTAVNLKLIEEIDEAGTMTRYEYDAKGNLLKKTEAYGLPEQRVTEYVVNALGQTTDVIRKGRLEVTGTTTPDATWHIEYDEQGQTKTITDPEGKLRRTQFDRAGNLVRMTDPRVKTTRYTVDALGHLTDVDDAIGRHWHYEYDKVGNLKTALNARSKITSYTYDAMNRREDTTNPVTGVHKLRYNGQGLPILETDEDGRSVQSTFDNFLRLVTRLDAAGNKTEYGYNIPDGSDAGSLGSLSQPTEIKYPTFTQQARLDARERPTSRTQVNPTRLGIQTLTNSVGYDKRGWPSGNTDAYDKSRTVEHDALGQVTSYTDSLQHTTQSDYDARGNLLRLIDAKQQATVFEYDGSDRVTKETLPLGQSIQYHYDDAGNLDWRIDANGHKTSFTYDDANRLREVRLFKGLNELQRLITYTPDEEDHLIAWEDVDYTRPAGQQTARADITYDDAGRKKTENVSYPNPQGGTTTLGYAYDYTLAGKKKLLQWPDGTQIGYDYSLHGELESVTIPGEGTITVDEFKWLQPAKLTLPGGSTQEHGFDGLLNLEELKVRAPGQQGVLDLVNTYGKAQELKGRTRTDSVGGVISTFDSLFQYDDELRLTQAQTTSGQDTDTEVFTLDAVANRTAHSRTPGEWVYDANNRLKQRGSAAASYEYDDAGNVTKRIEAGSLLTEFGYDTLNRLVEVKINSALAARYGYDPMHRRIWKEQYRDRQGNALAQAKRTLFLYADEGLIAEAAQDITLNADLSVSAAMAPQLTTQYGPRPEAPFTTGILFAKARDSNGGTRFAYLHADHLGAPLVATDNAGNIVWAATYEAFGAASIITPNSAPEVSTIAFNLRLPGQYIDPETGLHYNWNRYYDPTAGRYITTDPIGVEAGANLYVFVSGGPTWQSDVTGLMGNGPGGMSKSSRVDKGSACHGGPRLPDFVNFQLDWGLGSVWGTFTRDGHSFAGFGFNRGYLSPYSVGGNVSAGWLNSVTISPGQTNRFADGYAGGLTGAYDGVGGGIMYSPGNGTATVVGFGAGISYGNLRGGAAVGAGRSWDMGENGAGWGSYTPACECAIHP